MLNDYHGIRIARAMGAMPDDMVHSLANEVELKLLEARIKVDDIAVFFESLYRQLPKVYSVQLTNSTGVVDQLS